MPGWSAKGAAVREKKNAHQKPHSQLIDNISFVAEHLDPLSLLWKLFPNRVREYVVVLWLTFWPYMISLLIMRETPSSLSWKVSKRLLHLQPKIKIWKQHSSLSFRLDFEISTYHHTFLLILKLTRSYFELVLHQKTYRLYYIHQISHTFFLFWTMWWHRINLELANIGAKHKIKKKRYYFAP